MTSFHSPAKNNIRKSHGVKSKNLQGPEGAVSSVFTGSLQKLHYCLISLPEEYPHIVHKMDTKAITTKMNDLIFINERPSSDTRYCFDKLTMMITTMTSF